jgi:hypothetical protein
MGFGGAAHAGPAMHDAAAQESAALKTDDLFMEPLSSGQ